MYAAERVQSPQNASNLYGVFCDEEWDRSGECNAECGGFLCVNGILIDQKQWVLSCQSRAYKSFGEPRLQSPLMMPSGAGALVVVPIEYASLCEYDYEQQPSASAHTAQRISLDLLRSYSGQLHSIPSRSLLQDMLVGRMMPSVFSAVGASASTHDSSINTEISRLSVCSRSLHLLSLLKRDLNTINEVRDMWTADDPASSFSSSDYELLLDSSAEAKAVSSSDLHAGLKAVLNYIQLVTDVASILVDWTAGNVAQSRASPPLAVNLRNRLQRSVFLSSSAVSSTDAITDGSAVPLIHAFQPPQPPRRKKVLYNSPLACFEDSVATRNASLDSDRLNEFFLCLQSHLNIELAARSLLYVFRTYYYCII